MVADSVFFAPVWLGDDGRDVLVYPVPADAVGDVFRWIEKHIPPPHRVAKWAGYLLAVPHCKLVFAATEKIVHPRVRLAGYAVSQWRVVEAFLFAFSHCVVAVAPVAVVVHQRVPAHVSPV